MELLGPHSGTAYAAFAVFGVLAVLGALATVIMSNPIRAAMGLFVHVLSLAGLYLTLSAHFLGVIQLMVYAGAVVVLFVFVIMLLGPAAAPPSDPKKDLGSRVFAGLAAGGVGALLVANLVYVLLPYPALQEGYGTLKHIGNYLFNDAKVPFEFISVTLVVAVVGAFAVARGAHKRSGGKAPDQALGPKDSTGSTEAHS